MRALPNFRLWLSDKPRKPLSQGTAWVSFPAGDGDPLALLHDDPRKAEHLDGLNFGWLQLLTHLPSARHGMSAEAAPIPSQPLAEQSALLGRIDQGLLALIRVPRLSDEV